MSYRTIGGLLAALFCLLFVWLAVAATASVSWDAVTTNEDGTTIDDLAGYKVYRETNGTGGFELIGATDALTTTYADTLVGNGRHCYQVTAYDAAGNESAPSVVSAQACKTVDTILPGTPANVRVN